MTDISPTQAVRRKQYLFAASILAAIAVLSTIGVLFTNTNEPTAITLKRDVKTKSYIAPGEKVEPQDAWRGVADDRLVLLEGKIRDLEVENRTLSDKAKVGTTPPAGTPQALTDDDIDRRLREYQKAASPTSPTGAQQYPIAPPPGAVGSPPPPPSSTAAAQPAPPRPSNSMLVVTLSPSPSGTQKAGTIGASSDSAKPVRTAENYFPSGMFGQAVLLSGMDAPTGGQAQSNPHPILLQLRNPGTLPNGFKQDWHECHITASGYGDISSERSYIRTESMSCVSASGEVVDIDLKGYIVGEDGKAGMRGRLVSKQGQALANALLAGVVSGIGSGIEKQASVQSVSPLGTTSTIKPGEEYVAGIGQGVNKALDRLANYYISLAEKLFPVIEIDAGRLVDVVLTKGVYLDGQQEKK